MCLPPTECECTNETERKKFMHIESMCNILVIQPATRCVTPFCMPTSAYRHNVVKEDRTEKVIVEKCRRECQANWFTCDEGHTHTHATTKIRWPMLMTIDWHWQSFCFCFRNVFPRSTIPLFNVLSNAESLCGRENWYVIIEFYLLATLGDFHVWVSIVRCTTETECWFTTKFYRKKKKHTTEHSLRLDDL